MQREQALSILLVTGKGTINTALHLQICLFLPSVGSGIVVQRADKISQLSILRFVAVPIMPVFFRQVLSNFVVSLSYLQNLHIYFHNPHSLFRTLETPLHSSD